MNRLEVLGRKGHTTVEWDPDNPEQVEAARAEFDKLRDAGFLLFVVEEREVITLPAGVGRVEARLVAAGDVTPASKPEPIVAAGAPKRPRGTQARKFEPKAKRTVAVPPMRGG